ncbi:MFS transporter [Aeromonas hydrophila]
MKPVTTTPAAIHLALLVNMLSMGSMMMVMPLGPDLVISLGMQPEQTGYFSGGATLGAALMGLIAAPWLDRVNRKPALLVLLTLRFLLLMACALVQNSQQLLVLFVLSGCVAGPLAAILMAAVLDLVPPAERGRRLAYVGMAFSLAAILVVPIALVLAQWFGWQSPSCCLASAACCWPCSAPPCCLRCRSAAPSRQRPAPVAGLPALPGRPVHPLFADVRSLPADPALCQLLPVQPGVPARADRRPLSVRRSRQHGHHAAVRQLD